MEATLKAAVEGKMVRGSYKVVVGGSKPSASTVMREGVSRDEFKGFVETVRTTKSGHVILTMRTYNRITAGSRSAVTDLELALAEADPRLYKGLPGEFQFRTYRLEGVLSLEVCRGGLWFPVLGPTLAVLRDSEAWAPLLESWGEQ